jgi:hypothetical protein
LYQEILKMKFLPQYDARVGVAEGKKGNVVEFVVPRTLWQLGKVYVKQSGKKLLVSPLPRTGFDEVTIKPNGQVDVATKSKATDRFTSTMALDPAQGVYAVDLQAAA